MYVSIYSLLSPLSSLSSSLCCLPPTRFLLLLSLSVSLGSGVFMENSARLQLACAPAIKLDKPLVIRPFRQTACFFFSLVCGDHIQAVRPLSCSTDLLVSVRHQQCSQLLSPSFGFFWTFMLSVLTGSAPQHTGCLINKRLAKVLREGGRETKLFTLTLHLSLSSSAPLCLI